MANESISGPDRGDGPASGKGGPTSGAADYAESTAVDIAEKRERRKRAGDAAKEESGSEKKPSVTSPS